ncbi:MAG TPA: ankyrin repeat domain-containing protein, partial [Terriglobales bacterium]
HGGDPIIGNSLHGRNAAQIAAHRGRADILQELAARNIDPHFGSIDAFIAACAFADLQKAEAILSEAPELRQVLIVHGGNLLAPFAGIGNTEGVGCLLDLGVPVDALYHGDGYFDIAPNSTALHVAAWRARPATVKLLIERGAPVNALDGKGRTALQLAVRACVDSYWKNRRTPESIQALLDAGATTVGIELPTGYAEADELLAAHLSTH